MIGAKFLNEVLEKFRAEVCARSQAVDPQGERDWYDLSYGFFLGLGLDPEDAHTAANEARYTHQYWGAE
jgi:hypothetical protein